MFTVRTPARGYNGISAGVRFTAGVGQTDNPAALAYFSRAGYTIEPEAPQAPPEPVVEIVPDAYAGLTKKELLALAAERGVEIEPRATNPVIREALIAAALAEEEANSVPTPAMADPEPDPFAPGTEG